METVESLKKQIAKLKADRKVLLDAAKIAYERSRDRKQLTNAQHGLLWKAIKLNS